jgi:Mn2+/Fe2+ NRAMP family transporter
MHRSSIHPLAKGFNQFEKQRRMVLDLKTRRPTRTHAPVHGVEVSGGRRNRNRGRPVTRSMATVSRARTLPHNAAVWVRRHPGVLAFAAVCGPGLLAGLSDDDPAGITTYSILGADFGYRLLWVLLFSTVTLIVFHELGARLGVVTGRGLIGLIRTQHGAPLAVMAAVVLVAANIGTTAAEFAGVAASLGLAGVTRYLSVPVAAVLVTTLVVKGSFRRVEHVLLALAAVFVAYIISGLLAHPDWNAAARGLVVPSLPLSRHALLVATATLGTTLAPWGLAFIQSYAVDKRLGPQDLRYERFDVLSGALLTGVIGFFVVIACAATLHRQGHSIHDARDAAVALRPLAGSFASTLFAVGLLGASLLAAAVLPLSTAYSVTEAAGREGRVEGKPRNEPVFYGTYFAVTALGAGIVLVPGAPLVPILFLTQALNALLLLPLLILMIFLARDRSLMGEYAATDRQTVVLVALICVVALCTVGLAVFAFQ